MQKFYKKKLEKYNCCKFDLLDELVEKQEGGKIIMHG